MAALTRRLRAVAPVDRALRLTFRSSSAAIQYDYYDGDDEYRVCRPAPMADTEGSVPERGVQWVMIGEAGSKRHVFADRLSKLLRVPHISMPTLLTQDLNPRSVLYHQIAKALDEGKLVPQEIIFGLLSKKLEEGDSRSETGFILDGIPRTRIQAGILDEIVHVDLVVNFKCSEERFTPSREYPRMGSCMSATKLLRHEHSEYSLKENVHNHADELKLLEEYYRKQNKLMNFEVGGAPNETWQGLLAALHLQHMNCSQKLTA